MYGENKAVDNDNNIQVIIINECNKNIYYTHLLLYQL